MIALCWLLAAMLFVAPLTAAAQTAPDVSKLEKAERKAQKKEEIAREKAAVSTPRDAKAALGARK